MENEEWQETVEALVEAKRCLARSWGILDGTDGAAPGVEHALSAALAGIDAVYAIEHQNAFNADVASPRRCRSSGSGTARFQGSRSERDHRFRDARATQRGAADARDASKTLP